MVQLELSNNLSSYLLVVNFRNGIVSDMSSHCIRLRYCKVTSIKNVRKIFGFFGLSPLVRKSTQSPLLSFWAYPPPPQCWRPLWMVPKSAATWDRTWTHQHWFKQLHREQIPDLIPQRVSNPVGPPLTCPLSSHDDALLLEVCVELLVEVPGVGRRPPAGHARHVRLGGEVLALVEQQVRRGLVDLLGRDLLERQSSSSRSQTPRFTQSSQRKIQLCHTSCQDRRQHWKTWIIGVETYTHTLASFTFA